MVAWTDVSQYLISSKGAIERSPRLVEVSIPFDGTPVTTFVSSAVGPNDKLWVSIDALVGPMSNCEMSAASRLVGDVVCGGLVHMPIQGTDFLAIRHGMPIQDLPPERINDFLEPLYAASFCALNVQQKLGGSTSVGTGGFNQL